jgi:hypothetical protein
MRTLVMRSAVLGGSVSQQQASTMVAKNMRFNTLG